MRFFIDYYIFFTINIFFCDFILTFCKGVNMVNVGIVGYGNLGKALEEVMINDKNVNLVKIFSRRDGLKSRHKTEFDLVENLGVYKGRIDTLYLCVGSYSDIEKIGIKALKNFNK